MFRVTSTSVELIATVPEGADGYLILRTIMAPGDSNSTSELSKGPAPFIIPFTVAAGSTTCPKPAKRTRNFAAPRPTVSSEPPAKRRLSSPSVLQAPDSLSSLDEIHSRFTEGSDVAMDEEAEDDASSGVSTPDVSIPQPPVLEHTVSQTLRTSAKKPRTKTSHIHEHISTRGDSFICNSCSRSYKISGGTGAIARHLKKYHSITPTASGPAAKRTQERTAIDEAVLRPAKIDHNTQGKRREEMMGNGLDRNTLEYLYLKWTISQNLPLDLVRDERFRTFLEYINPAANRMLPSSESTMKIHAESLLAGEDYKLLDDGTS